jgi:hypothetical protein
MVGLEYLADAARAQVVEDAKRPQHQFLPVGLKQLVDLVDGQPAAPDQFLGEQQRTGTARPQDARDLIQLRWPQQFLLAQLFQQAVEGIDGHGFGPGTGKPV